jgi:hypothetical protein
MQDASCSIVDLKSSCHKYYLGGGIFPDHLGSKELKSEGSEDSFKNVDEEHYKQAKLA